MGTLHTLSRRFGIVDVYVDQSGTERRATSDETRVALLGAMGVDASTEAASAASLSELDARAATEALSTVAVVRERDASHVAIRPGDDARWMLRVRVDGGSERTREGRGNVTVDLGALGHGYHELELEYGGQLAKQRRIVTPERCPSVAEVVGRPRAFGIAAQLYAVRSRRNWGIGDCGDLDMLVDRAAAWGAAFVGLNPLHALRNVGADVSPYSPLSRLFGNWIYIDLAAVPEHDGVEPSDIGALRAAAQVDYDRVTPRKREALRRAYDAFVAGASAERRRAFDVHRARGGRELEDFATFSILSAAERARFPGPSASGLQSVRIERRDDIAFECWLQFELDRQLERSATRARERGLGIGLYQDLAIGCAPDGSDVWAHPDLFVKGVAIGAPPDGYSKEGQNWGLPPMSPHRLRADGYRYWSTLLRRAFAHGGALRMDHVIGLFRQFWIPDGMRGRDGAFVDFPAEDLLGILALEASRARAVVVGEDLGTMPEEVPGVLARYGVLSSRVLYFEVANGEFLPSTTYPTNALTTANTHDMAPLAGWLGATDIAARARVGIIDDAAAALARSARRMETVALRRQLGDDGTVTDTGASFAGAVHAFLARTPSALVGVSLDDITGESEAVNVPGASPEQHPSWRRRYSVAVEDLPETSSALPPALRER